MPTTPPTPPTLTSPQAQEAPPQPGGDAPQSGRANQTPPPAVPAHGPDTAYLTAEQIGVLLKDIAPSRVAQMAGASHVEAWDIRAHLNRIFGFGRWSSDVTDMRLLYEDKIEDTNEQTKWRCGYMATLRLRVCAPDGTLLASYTECAAGDTFGSMPDSKRAEAHDQAIKTAESQALKRCATNLGTQFGLSLYDNGRYTDVVRKVLVGGA